MEKINSNWTEPINKNYCNKLTTSLEVDGKIIKDKKNT